MNNVSDIHPVTSPSSQRIAVFGATRGIGREAARLALAAGHEVTALVRDRSRMDLSDPGLTVLEGDAMDLDAVRSAVRGADAVVCALGAPAWSASKVRSQGTATIVQAMEELGVQRLVCVSVLGAHETRESLPFFLKYVFFPLYLRRAAREHERQEDVVRASDLRWTLVRPPHLTDGPHTGEYVHGVDVDLADLSMKISRADVADFALRALEEERYLHGAAAVSYAA